MAIKLILKDKDGADAELSAKEIEDSFKETLKLLNDDDDSQSETEFDDDDFDIEGEDDSEDDEEDEKDS